MRSLEIIWCLFIVIFALAVAHPLPEDVLEQVEAIENDGGILAQESIQTQVLPSLKLDPTAPALEQKDPSKPGPAFLFNNPTAPALEPMDPSRPEPALLPEDPTAPAFEPKVSSRTEPALLPEDPTAPALELKYPSRPEPAFLLKDPTAPADLQKLLADVSASSSDMSQDDLQEQKDSEEAFDVILNEEAQLQKEE